MSSQDKKNKGAIRSRTKSGKHGRTASGVRLALEQRVLLDAAIADTVHKAVDASLDDGVPADTSGNLADRLAPSNVPTTILFVDSSVDDANYLLAKASAGVEVHFIRADADGLAQIADAIKGRSNISSIHIVSHGDAGRLTLGNTVLDQAALEQHASAIRGLALSLSADADILLYGCNVGEGEAGAAFVNTLSRLSGADVAASVDVTGASTLGGDWDLEMRVGAVDARMAFSAEVYSDYSGIFAENFVTDGDLDHLSGSDQPGTPDGLVAADKYGWAVASATVGTDEWKFVSAPGKDSSQGAVYAYKYNTGTKVWTLAQTITAPTRQNNDQFGYDVDCDGQTLVISAIAGGGGDAGAVFVYRLGSSWGLTDTLDRDDVSEFTSAGGQALQFGYSVAVAREGTASRIIVGAIGDDLDAEGGDRADVGAAYVFTESSGGAYGSSVRIIDPNAGASTFIGSAVGITYTNSAWYAAIGAQGAASNEGLVAIAKLEGSAWNLKGTIYAPTRATGEYFGASLALEKDRLIVGAPGADANFGEAVAYSRSGDTYASGVALSAGSSLVAGDQFGRAVDIAGDIAVASAPGSDRLAVYRYSGGAWGVINQVDFDFAAGELGYSVGLNSAGTELVIGANAIDAFSLHYNYDPTAVNDGTLASPFQVVGEDDVSVDLNVLANDSDSNTPRHGDVLTIAVPATSNSGAALTVTADNQVRYSPGTVFQYLSAGQTLKDSFTYTVSDGNGGEKTATVYVDVLGSNDAPVVIRDIPPLTVEGGVGAAKLPFSQGIAVANHFSDVDNPLPTSAGSYSVQYSSNGSTWTTLPITSAGLDLSWTLSGGVITLSGNVSETVAGTHMIRVRVNDVSGGSVTTEFSLIVTRNNVAPTVVGSVPALNLTQGDIGTLALPSNLFADTDPEDVTLQYSARLASGASLPSWLTFNSSSRVFSYATNQDAVNGSPNVVRVIATDSLGESAFYDFTINVANVNDAPEATTSLQNQEAYVGDFFQYVLPDGLFRDVDGDAFTLTAAQAGGGALPSWLSFDGFKFTANRNLVAGDITSTPFVIRVTATENSGSPRESGYVDFQLSVKNAPWISFTDKIYSPSPAGLAEFGFSVASSKDGNTIVVGSPYANSGAGAAWVFTRSGSSWVSAALTRPAGAANNFGWSVDIADDLGNKVVVGARGTDLQAGTAHVYSGSAWSTRNDLAPTGGQASQTFGNSVAISDDGAVVAVGAANYDHSSGGTIYSNSGAVYYFTGTNYATQTRLTDSQGVRAGENFGSSVALATVGGTTLLAVGSTGDFNNISEVGSVHLYKNGTFSTRLFASDSGDRDLFGWDVDLDSETGDLIVGAPQQDTQKKDTGAVYIYDYNGTSWGNEKKIELPSEQVAANFGSSVAIRDGVALAGALLFDRDGQDMIGSAWVLDYSAGTDTWNATQLLSRDRAAGDKFGQAVALGGKGATEKLFVAAVNDDDVGNDAGLVMFLENRTPGFAVPNQVAYEDSSFSFNLRSLPEFSGATFNVTQKPAWLAFNASTGVFSGTPVNGDVGSGFIQVTVTGGTKPGIYGFVVRVFNTNDAPTFSGTIPGQTRAQGQNLFVPVSTFFADDDLIHGDQLTYTFDGSKPAWLSLVTSGGITYLSGTPDDAGVGSFSNIRIRATDQAGAYVISNAFGTTVTNVNDAPVIGQGIPDQQATEDVAFSYPIPSDAFFDADAEATDSPKDTIIYTFTANVDNMQLLGGRLLNGAAYSSQVFTAAGQGYSRPVINLVDGQDVVLVDDVNAADSVTGYDLGATWTISGWYQGINTVDTYATLTRGGDVTGSLGDHQILIENGILGSFDNAGGGFISTGYDLRALGAGWHHIVAVGAGGQTTFYVDGVKVPTTIAFQSQTNIYAIGNYQGAGTVGSLPPGGGQRWANYIADVSVSNGALSAAQVAALYRSGPLWFGFNGTAFSGTPGNFAKPSVDITVRATDAAGTYAEDTFALTVQNVNDAPVLKNGITGVYDAGRSLFATDTNLPFTLSIPSTAFDDYDLPFGDSIAYSIQSSLPAWLTFDASTGTFTSTSGASAAGDTVVTIRVTDEAGAYLDHQLVIRASGQVAPANILFSGADNGTTSVNENNSGHAIAYLSAVDANIAPNGVTNYWRLNEASGSSALASRGGVALQVEGAGRFITDETNGQVFSTELAGSLQSAAPVSMGTNWTFSLAFKGFSFASSPVILGDAASGKYVGVKLVGANYELGYYNGTSFVSSGFALNTLDPAKWYSLTVIQNNGQISFYGSEQGQENPGLLSRLGSAVSASVSMGQFTNVGGQGGLAGTTFARYVDEVRFFNNRAMNPYERIAGEGSFTYAIQSVAGHAASAVTIDSTGTLRTTGSGFNYEAVTDQNASVAGQQVRVTVRVTDDTGLTRDETYEFTVNDVVESATISENHDDLGDKAGASNDATWRPARQVGTLGTWSDGTFSLLNNTDRFEIRQTGSTYELWSKQGALIDADGITSATSFTIGVRATQTADPAVGGTVDFNVAVSLTDVAESYFLSQSDTTGTKSWGGDNGGVEWRTIDFSSYANLTTDYLVHDVGVYFDMDHEYSKDIEASLYRDSSAGTNAWMVDQLDRATYYGRDTGADGAPANTGWWFESYWRTGAAGHVALGSQTQTDDPANRNYLPQGSFTVFDNAHAKRPWLLRWDDMNDRTLSEDDGNYNGWRMDLWVTPDYNQTLGGTTYASVGSGPVALLDAAPAETLAPVQIFRQLGRAPVTAGADIVSTNVVQFDASAGITIQAATSTAAPSTSFLAADSTLVAAEAALVDQLNAVSVAPMPSPVIGEPDVICEPGDPACEEPAATDAVVPDQAGVRAESIVVPLAFVRPTLQEALAAAADPVEQARTDFLRRLMS